MIAQPALAHQCLGCRRALDQCALEVTGESSKIHLTREKDSSYSVRQKRFSQLYSLI